MSTQEKKTWFAASMRNGQGKKTARLLSEMGIGFYIPTSYNTLLFLNTAKSNALSLVNSGTIKARFFIDHGTRTLLEVPDKQMEDFIRVTQSPFGAECIPLAGLAKGDKVIVAEGPLMGVEGEIVEFDEGAPYLVVRVLSLMCARVKVPLESVRPASFSK